MGSWYSILQDGPNSFHMSVQNGQYIRYEHFENVPSIEELEKNVYVLENELLSPQTTDPLTLPEEPAILQDEPQEQTQGETNGI